jgi:hypothetical protein
MLSKSPARTKALAENAYDIVCKIRFIKKPPSPFDIRHPMFFDGTHTEHKGDWICEQLHFYSAFLLTCFTTGRCTMKKVSPCAALGGFSVHRMRAVAAHRLYLHKC